MSRVVRTASWLGLAVAVAFAVLAASQVLIPGWWHQDTDAYWGAALRLREGLPLYPDLASIDASSVYRYSPWFAAAWVPMTFLPRQVVYIAWTVVLMTAAALCLWPAIRTRTLAGASLAILIAGMLIPAAASGNVQPLLLATLIFGVERRSGPLWIAIAASLKAAPILLIAVYLGRREWVKAVAAAAITALLLLPFLAVNLSNYPTDVGAATGPLPTWAALGLAGILTISSLVVARTRLAWLSSCAAVLFAIPRWSYYQPTFLLVGLAERGKATR